MVLFLFIIMLLDLKAEVRRKVNPIAVAGAGAVVILFVLELITVIERFPLGNRGAEPLAVKLSDSHAIGMMLFSSYNLPFQVIAVLVLVASIGVVVLGKRELK